VSGALDGGHAVRVYGWGTEGGIDYWLVANSWNVYWGANGSFKIKRGTNECGFESDFIVGNV
jgi:cathepsin B